MRPRVPHLLPPPHPPPRPRRRLVLPLLPLPGRRQIRRRRFPRRQEAQAVPAGPDEDRRFLQDPAEPARLGVVGDEEAEAEARGGDQEEEEAAALQSLRGPRAAAPPDGLPRHRAHRHRRRLQQPPHLPARHGAALRQPRRPRGRRDAGASEGGRGGAEPVPADDGAGGVPAAGGGVRPSGGVHGGGGPVHPGPHHHHRVRRRRRLPPKPGARRRRQHDDAALGVRAVQEPSHLPRPAEQHRALHQRHQQPHAGGEEEAEPKVRAIRRRRRVPGPSRGQQGHLQGGEALLRLQWLRARVPHAPFRVSQRSGRIRAL